MHRIREAMKADDPDPLGGPGKTLRATKPLSAAKKKRLSGKVAPKKKIVTLVERGGRARSFHVAQCRLTRTFAPRWSRTSHRSSILHDRRRPFLHTASAASSPATERRFTATASSAVATATTPTPPKTSFRILKRGVIGTYHHWSRTTFTAIWPSSISAIRPRMTTDNERSDASPQGHRWEAPDLSADYNARSLITFKRPSLDWRAPQALD